MTITINTDASYSHEHKVGAFAFWIVCDHGRIITSGALKSVNNSQDAELQAVGNALYYLLKSSFSDIRHIYINTDCITSINMFTKNQSVNGCNETKIKIQRIISKLVIKYSFSKKKDKRFKKFISWRHVKAHTNGTDKRRWVNNTIDELAKDAMKKALKQMNA